MKILIQNDTIKLAYTQEQDIPFVLEAEQQQENATYIGQWSFQQHLNALTDADVLHLIIKNADDKNIGYIIIKGLCNQNDSIELMRIVVVDRGAGYGKMTLALIKKWCFEMQKAHRLWLDVREHNARAQHVYQSQGFVHEGVLRECVKVGDTFESLAVMSILSQDYYAV